jgi:hypothetical protein
MAPVPSSAETPSETHTSSPEPEEGGKFHAATVVAPITVCIAIVLIWILGAWARRYARQRRNARQPDVERDADSQLYLRNSRDDDRQGERHARFDTTANQREPSIPSSGSYKKLTLEARVQRMVEQAFDDVVDRVIKDVVERNLELSVEKMVEDAVQRMFDNRAAQAEDGSEENDQDVTIVTSVSQTPGSGIIKRPASTTGFASHHSSPILREPTRRNSI